MVFGRTEQADIVIAEDPLLSSSHFRISIEGDDCQIEDMQSTNGTKLNDQRIMTRPIHDGDRIIAGQSTFTVQADSPDVCLQSTWVPEAVQQAEPEPVAVAPRSPVVPPDDPGESADRAVEPAEEFDAYETSETAVDEQPNRTPQRPSEPVPPKPLNRPTGNAAADPVPAETLPPRQTTPLRREPAPSTPASTTPTTTPPPSELTNREPTAPTAGVAGTPVTASGPRAGTDGSDETTDSPAPPVETPSALLPGQVPENLQIQLRQCATGLWCANQTTNLLGPAELSVILAGACPLRMTVDFSRTGLKASQISNPNDAKYLVSEPPDEASKDTSPRIVNADGVAVDQWIRSGWGTDGMVVLVTHVDIDPILGYFQSLLSSSDHGITSVCRPSMLESILSSGDPKLAQEIVEPCEAILLESPETPGSWSIYGDDRLIQLLDGCCMSHRS